MAPLSQLRVLITRTRHQASTLAQQLEALGAETIVVPTIELAPPRSFCALDAALTCLPTYDWIIFTSANAVQAFQQRSFPLSSGVLPRSAPSGSQPSRNRASTRLPRIAVIGPATARAVQGIGLHIDLLPPHYVAESLAAALAPYAPGASMLLVRAEQARDILPETLTAAGATITIADAYRTITPPGAVQQLQQLLADQDRIPHAVTFTSSSTAANLFTLLEAAGLSLPPQVALASIGPVTSQTLRDLGHAPRIEAREPTIPALCEALARYFAQPA